MKYIKLLQCKLESRDVVGACVGKKWQYEEKG